MINCIVIKDWPFELLTKNKSNDRKLSWGRISVVNLSDHSQKHMPKLKISGWANQQRRKYSGGWKNQDRPDQRDKKLNAGKGYCLPCHQAFWVNKLLKAWLDSIFIIQNSMQPWTAHSGDQPKKNKLSVRKKKKKNMCTMMHKY